MNSNENVCLSFEMMLECITEMPKRSNFIKTLLCGIHKFSNNFFPFCIPSLPPPPPPSHKIIIYILFGRKQKPLQTTYNSFILIFMVDDCERTRKRSACISKIINRNASSWCDPNGWEEKRTAQHWASRLVALNVANRIFIIDSKRHLYINQVQCSWYFGFLSRNVFGWCANSAPVFFLSYFYRSIQFFPSSCCY